jgi:DNA polymerase IIIc chi subunit
VDSISNCDVLVVPQDMLIDVRGWSCVRSFEVFPSCSLVLFTQADTHQFIDRTKELLRVAVHAGVRVVVECDRTEELRRALRCAYALHLPENFSPGDIDRTLRAPDYPTPCLVVSPAAHLDELQLQALLSASVIIQGTNEKLLTSLMDLHQRQGSIVLVLSRAQSGLEYAVPGAVFIGVGNKSPTSDVVLELRSIEFATTLLMADDMHSRYFNIDTPYLMALNLGIVLSLISYVPRF